MGNNKDEKKEQEEQTPEEEEQQEEEELAATGSEASEDEESDADDDASDEESTEGDDASDQEDTTEDDESSEDASEETTSDEEDASDEDADEEVGAAGAAAPAEEADEDADEESEVAETEEQAEKEAADAEAGAADVEVDSTGEPISVHTLEGVAAFFEHPKHLLAAATYARDSDYEEFDAYSPFPIHGMDEAMGLGRSWIPWVTFGAGVTGFILANALQFGTMTFDWPMIIGGKPFAPWPSFVPIMFELTVLLAGVTTAVVMLKAAGCFKKPMIIDPSITDDRFVLWISAEDNKFNVDEVIDFLEDLNPLEVRKIVKDA
ncbi:DUF3341 domain-containing protein [Persicimonas caeni]|uniref:DUF3341 domain-containing protein n=1 Tax=Persicimonas caeni TaxID=2292766 RepID=A0A4Y6PP23_PERCE|nr:DUF3341 domain-containing protein [Persicimonas caeni]QDG49849.1 DUF3341 domain-containing protein [Persicimonas caeni]QED31070.1 DUF3341 domain-containing protein [Persicimonas caeni]